MSFYTLWMMQYGEWLYWHSGGLFSA